MSASAQRAAAVLIAAAAVMAVPQPAPGQQHAVDPAKAALIRRVLELTKAAQLAVTAIDASVPAQRQAMPQVPKEFWDEFVARVRRDTSRLIDIMIPIYESHFTIAQLEQLVTFYESPLGQHLTRVQPLIAKQSIQAGQQWGSQLAEEVAEDLARRGIQLPQQ